MAKIIPIVEGDGEVSAVPVLLKKILKERKRYDIQVEPPINANGRGNLTAPEGLEKFVELARREAQNEGVIFILLDAEEGCPLKVCKEFTERIKAVKVNCPVVLVAANRMYENWLIASVETICGQILDELQGLPVGLVCPDDCEETNGKVWIDRHLGGARCYKETRDQKAMTELLSPELARTRSRSFRRFYHAVEQAVQALDENWKDFLSPDFPPPLPQTQAAIVPPVSRRRKSRT